MDRDLGGNKHSIAVPSVVSSIGQHVECAALLSIQNCPIGLAGRSCSLPALART